MAGRILKITLEDTHPPVWRRVIIPEKITFRDLHDIIQILFGWMGYHLHSFENMNQGFMVDCLEDDDPMGDYAEDEILVDDYIETLPWIRYVYDFGDDWRHKIVFEKDDPSYKERFATLLKYKGDNPEEDCGGVSPWMSFVEFDPEETKAALAEMNIPRRKGAKKKSGRTRNEDSFEMMFDDLMENQYLDAAVREFRKQFPDMKGFSDNTIKSMLKDFVKELETETGENLLDPQNFQYSHDPHIQKQLELLYNGNSFTIVQSKKKLEQNLSEMNEQSISDYLKYCQCDDRFSGTPALAVSNYLLAHPELLFYFMERQEMERLLEFWDLYKSGQRVIEDLSFDAIGKCCTIGLIRLTGKRKLKLELCAEFELLMNQIMPLNISEIYDRIEDDITTIGSLLMAYIALPFDQMYKAYATYAKIVMDQTSFTRFIYWNGTMNHQLTTFWNQETGVNYITLPDMMVHFAAMERRGMDKLFKVPPRHLPKNEYKKWKLGFNGAIMEWDHYVKTLEIDEDFDEQFIFELYNEVASGTSMTELIMRDVQEERNYLDGDDIDLLAVESDLWHLYAELCLATPILGLNGYSREQYAKAFHASLDYIPLFDESVLKKRVDKRTRIYELPKDIQLAMIEALRKGEKEYARLLEHLRGKYKSNQAIEMESAWIMGEDFFDKEDSSDNAKMFDPWEMNLPKPETFVRETKKVGRNDPCPCGSGKKYKHCCGKGK